MMFYPRHAVWFGCATLFVMGGSTVNAADETPQPRTVSVSGRGRVNAPPNVGSISAGVTSQGTTAREALSANNQSMTALQAILKENGVEARDFQTIQVSVQPQYGQPLNQPGKPQVEQVSRIAGYQVQNLVRITVRDLNKLGDLLDALVGAGANQIYGVSFRTEGTEVLLETARKHAMADARKKAELLAAEAGLTVGTPISIRDEVGPYPVSPMQSAGPLVMAAPGSSVPVAVGEQELGASVQVVYELKTSK